MSYYSPKPKQVYNPFVWKNFGYNIKIPIEFFNSFTNSSMKKKYSELITKMGESEKAILKQRHFFTQHKNEQNKDKTQKNVFSSTSSFQSPQSKTGSNKNMKSMKEIGEEFEQEYLSEFLFEHYVELSKEKKVEQCYLNNKLFLVLFNTSFEGKRDSGSIYAVIKFKSCAHLHPNQLRTEENYNIVDINGNLKELSIFFLKKQEITYFFQSLAPEMKHSAYTKLLINSIKLQNSTFKFPNPANWVKYKRNEQFMFFTDYPIKLSNIKIKNSKKFGQIAQNAISLATKTPSLSIPCLYNGEICFIVPSSLKIPAYTIDNSSSSTSESKEKITFEYFQHHSVLFHYDFNERYYSIKAIIDVEYACRLARFFQIVEGLWIKNHLNKFQEFLQYLQTKKPKKRTKEIKEIKKRSLRIKINSSREKKMEENRKKQNPMFCKGRGGIRLFTKGKKLYEKSYTRNNEGNKFQQRFANIQGRNRSSSGSVSVPSVMSPNCPEEDTRIPNDVNGSFFSEKPKSSTLTGPSNLNQSLPIPSFSPMKSVFTQPLTSSFDDTSLFASTGMFQKLYKSSDSGFEDFKRNREDDSEEDNPLLSPTNPFRSLGNLGGRIKPFSKNSKITSSFQIPQNQQRSRSMNRYDTKVPKSRWTEISESEKKVKNSPPLSPIFSKNQVWKFDPKEINIFDGF